MEVFWAAAAALGAGIGTGLAGLSAATVMVPVLIVLCPSFFGETGAYHATAIALASDILGSAFTAGIYIRHKNIDLRRGAVMFACIVGMCIAGSFAAWQAGHVVLGGFSLFLCLGIGVRFLVKPDTQREHTVARGARLDRKGVAVSLFFGLTIGFGTGFVGSGGGMMMLVVFTAFLGMERKPAVGTSTFIMTFTALIAFISHAAIDPAILLERWPTLILCVAVTTAASIVSAQFANRVNARIAGLVTGGVLTALGAFMLVLHYREALESSPLLLQTLRCTGRYLCFILPAAAVLLLIHLAFRRIDRELFRKLLHIPAFASGAVIIAAAEAWQAAALTAVLFAVVIYPVLMLLERWRGYSRLFNQRRGGEVKNSLVLLFLTVAALIAACWGLLGRAYLASAALLMWGVGDGAAALIGKRFGRHSVTLPHADPKKSWEGSAAMTVASFAAGTVTLLAASPLSPAACLLHAAAAAPFAAAAELFSHNGNDTVSVPITAAAVLALLSLL